MLIAPYNDIETTSAIIDAHHDEMAAVIVEPLQRMISPQPGFLQGLRDITAKYNIPLIFDEVVTGFPVGLGRAPRSSTELHLTYAPWARSWEAATPWRPLWDAATSFRSTTKAPSTPTHL